MSQLHCGIDFKFFLMANNAHRSRTSNLQHMHEKECFILINKCGISFNTRCPYLLIHEVSIFISIFIDQNPKSFFAPCVEEGCSAITQTQCVLIFPTKSHVKFLLLIYNEYVRLCQTILM